MQAATVAVSRRVIRCDECQTPVAEVREGGLLLKTRHMGTTHVSIITWATLRALIAEHDEGKRAA